MAKLTHLADDGSPRMVDVSAKPATLRRAVVEAVLTLRPEHVEALRANAKGDVFVTAQVAGIQAGKQCSVLIPLCHTVPLSHLEVFTELAGSTIKIQAVAKAEGVTGVEMEAYVAVVVAGITLIDMLKGAHPDLTLGQIRLIEKSGGKAPFKRDAE